MKAKDITDMILPVGALILGYIGLQKLLPGRPDYDSSKPCPRGQRYSRPYFEECDPGYLDDGALFGAKCVCDAPPATPAQPPADQAPTSPPSGSCGALDFYNPLSPCFLGGSSARFPEQAPEYPKNDCGVLDFYNPLSPCFLGIRQRDTPSPEPPISSIAEQVDTIFSGVPQYGIPVQPLLPTPVVPDRVETMPVMILPAYSEGGKTTASGVEAIQDLLANPTDSMIRREESIAAAEAIMSEGGTRREVRFYFPNDGWQNVWKTDAEIAAYQSNMGSWAVRL